MLNNDLPLLIQQRLDAAYPACCLEVIDNTAQHHGHPAHAAGGMHFLVSVSAKALGECTRLEAHRKIYNLFTDLMPFPIHALQIKINSTKL